LTTVWTISLDWSYEVDLVHRLEDPTDVTLYIPLAALLKCLTNIVFPMFSAAVLPFPVLTTEVVWVIKPKLFLNTDVDPEETS